MKFRHTLCIQRRKAVNYYSVCLFIPHLFRNIPKSLLYHVATARFYHIASCLFYHVTTILNVTAGGGLLVRKSLR